MATSKHADGHSFICKLGEAIAEADDYYRNKPIDGLELELRARVVSERWNETGGHVLIKKHGQILKTFYPLGDLTLGVWDGDFFNAWDGTSETIKLFSQRNGTDGFVYFDLFTGKGFYSRRQYSDPELFVSKCERQIIKNLPVYRWVFN